MHRTWRDGRDARIGRLELGRLQRRACEDPFDVAEGCRLYMALTIDISILPHKGEYGKVFEVFGKSSR